MTEHTPIDRGPPRCGLCGNRHASMQKAMQCCIDQFGDDDGEAA